MSIIRIWRRFTANFIRGDKLFSMNAKPCTRKVLSLCISGKAVIQQPALCSIFDLHSYAFYSFTAVRCEKSIPQKTVDFSHLACYLTLPEYLFYKYLRKIGEM
jgi:hypothetical protein